MTQAILWTVVLVLAVTVWACFGVAGEDSFTGKKGRSSACSLIGFALLGLRIAVARII